MKKCRSCKQEIDPQATKCPHCQTDQRIWFRRHPVWTVIIALFIIGSISSAASGGTKTASTQDTNMVSKEQPTNKPTIQKIATTPVPTIAFNNKRGNNSVAATQAQKIMDAFATSTPGLVKDVYIELDPQDLGGKSEAEYEKSGLQGAQINIIVDGDSWNNTNDAVKKDFVSGLITAIHGNIGVYPSVTVNDGIRNVAEGSWSVWNGQADIKLE